MPAPTARAATRTVTSTNDIDDGICTPAHCSLREAIYYTPPRRHNRLRPGVAIEALNVRGITNGCDPSATPPLFCPADTTLRHQMAALIVRAMPGWAGESYTDTFTDPTDEAELWARVVTLQHHGVVGGYTAESCVA